MQNLSNTDMGSEHEMVVYAQTELDNAFADMEHLLDQQRPSSRSMFGRCAGCGGNKFVYNSGSHGFPGSSVCTDCGVVVEDPVFYETMYGNFTPHKSSNYKRIHHWHERISQLLLQESEIPAHDMLEIAKVLCNGSYEIINKDNIRAVLRSLNKQLYIEKWLQIIYRLTKICPPMPGPSLIQQLDALFLELQRPFDAYHAPGRKNFLNYNYVFCRLFQHLGCPQFCMFFPLIKSKVKLRALDDMWKHMVECINWKFTPLMHVSPFAVCLEQPAALLQRLSFQLASPIPVVPEKAPWRMECRKWGHHLPKRHPQLPKRHRSAPFGPEFQRLGLLKKRLR